MLSGCLQLFFKGLTSRAVKEIICLHLEVEQVLLQMLKVLNEFHVKMILAKLVQFVFPFFEGFLIINQEQR